MKTSINKLVIFPGAGSPDAREYRKAYAVFTQYGERYGINEIDTTIRWPGQTLNYAILSETLTFSTSLVLARRRIEELEKGTSYVILGRSYGTMVALRAVLDCKPQKMQSMILWGPPPLWRLWEGFVRDWHTEQQAALRRGTRLADDFFSQLQPIESLCCHAASANIPIVIATGEVDQYSPPTFLDYLESLTRHCDCIKVKRPVKGAGHTITTDSPREVIEDYMSALFG